MVYDWKTYFFIFVTLILLSNRTFADSCNGSDCTFQGVLNKPLGNATLSINESGQLVVDNIGGSGQDGVVQTQLQSLYMKTSLATPNLSGSIQGTNVDIRQLGIADGQSGEELMSTRLINFNGSDIRHSIDCSFVLVEGYTIHIYNGDNLVVEQHLGIDPPLLIYPKVDLETIACGIWPNGDLYTVFRLGSPQPITLLTSPVDQGPFTGDKVLVTAFSPQKLPTLQTDIENNFMNTGPMRFDSIAAKPFYDVVNLVSTSTGSDCNGDNQVNVLDLVCIANNILSL